MRGAKKRRDRPISDRNLAVYMARRAGTQYRDIAAEHGITVVRARQIYEKWDRCFSRGWRSYYVPIEVLAHQWTAETQRAELDRERTAWGAAEG